MSIIAELTDSTAVVAALDEFDKLGRDVFLDVHGFGRATRYYLMRDAKYYDPKAIAGVAYGYQHPERAVLTPDDFSSGRDHSNSVLQALGFFILDRRPTTVDEERASRIAIWADLNRTQIMTTVEPRVLRAYGVYGGQQGVWVDAERTRGLDVTCTAGVTVGILHTGAHYPDDLSDHGVIYHYPNIKRQGGWDKAEVEATKAAARLDLPIFMIAYPTPSSAVRSVKLAWVEGWDDAAETFLITYGDQAPGELLVEDHSDDLPFQPEGNRSQRAVRKVRVRPDQRKFKFQVTQRYGQRCPLSGIEVPEMLEAAHLRGDAQDGSSDPRNGVLLNAALHRAFDANLFAFDPDTLDVVVRPQGPSISQLGITCPHLRGLSKKPHPDALRWRYEAWRSRL